MKDIRFYSTNDPGERVDFQTALLAGMASRYGLYMIGRKDIPTLSRERIDSLKGKPYAQIAYEVLEPFLGREIPPDTLKDLLNDAYEAEKIPTILQHVTGKTYIMWLTRGPTYSFKDYAARFFGRTLNFFLGERGLRRVVIVATSGDTGGAVADALLGLGNIDNIVFYPKGSISEGQRRQMTTLGNNIYAFEVNGDFDVCQALAKNILGDRDFAVRLFDDPDRFTSANSISVGRLLPQAVYPFYAYSQIETEGQPFIASIPSGNFGNMMGTVIARQMGLPVKKIICGVNENREFPEFLSSGTYTVRPSVKSPSSAMIVSHPSNLARLIDFYGGHMFDERDSATGNVVKPGVIDRMPDLEAMRRDICSLGISNAAHFATMKAVYDRYGIILDPHGAVGWATLDQFLEGKHDRPAVVYETADPGKFPDDVRAATGVTPEVPPGMKKQAGLPERIYTIEAPPDHTSGGLALSRDQISEAKAKVRQIYTG
ncbi:MAG: threonine synthase [Syntrophorhabdaceae bacterium]|nr:threonine synthase [Syntrophorhabdaceae bacterium]MDD4195953.1 threonine synthase [Syntrophorhabdaceae bacterium]HOC46737.1 threonine synthase [Syntrophorhabdaceae bacterium]